MAEISRIKLSETTYELKDAAAREAIARIASTSLPVSCPFFVSKESKTYLVDVADDEEGIDWTITEVESGSNTLALPFSMEKGDLTYIFDIADDEEGIDWVITKKEG